MPAWRLRDYHEADLDQAIQIWDQSRGSGSAEPVFSVAEVMAAARSRPARSGGRGGRRGGRYGGGAGSGRAGVDHAGGHRLAMAGPRRGHRALLADLERRLRSQGVRRISAAFPESATGAAALENSGYTRRDGLVYYEMMEHLGPDQANLLDELGGMMLPPGLWGDLAGMEYEKQIIERRIVDPLAHPEVAERYGVSPPKAVILFGPPGTGKTSFAKAVASRLGWPFVELFPSRLAAIGTGGLAASLREAFAELAELDELVLFIDEVEEIATARSGASTAELGVTNELLKLIPAFRQHDSRLLVCATNAVHSLDSAFLRPGRFDYVIPVGPPDPPARSAVWAAIPRCGQRHVDVDRLATASELFTPADIEFAARKGAQAAFEREMRDGGGRPATTEDYLTAIGEVRPTLSADMLAEFERGKADFARL